MKKQSLHGNPILFIVCILIIATLISCRTSDGTDHDQTVKSAIDLADKYVDAGQYERALSVYDRALSQTTDYRLTYNRILVLALTGEYEKAQMLCQEGFSDYPYILRFKKTQASLLIELGKTGDAADCYSTVLEKDPYDTDTRKKLIELLIESGKTDEAYDNAIILWNQGYQNRENCMILYNLKPEEWENVLSLY